MTMLSKEELLNKIMSEEKPKCPYCGKEMSLWEVPHIHVGDGLGWGTPYLFVCFNDECSMYVEGWKSIKEHYGHHASYRCMCYPGTTQFECMTVFGTQGGKGQIIDDQAIIEQEMIKERTKRGFSILADCYNSKDGVTVVKLLTDSSEPPKVRLKAAEMIGDIGTLEAIDVLRSARFSSEIIQNQVNKSIQKIHERYFTRECPHCAEIIKMRASVCKHCGKSVVS